MKILITGATGNVGSAVIERLRGGGHELHAGVRDTAKARRVFDDEVKVHALDFKHGVQPDESFDALMPTVRQAVGTRCSMRPTRRAQDSPTSSTRSTALPEPGSCSRAHRFPPT